MIKKAPDPVDKHVGSRVRMRRVLVGMSQERLGEALGLTFQQIQKYEKGANRIGASRLQQISSVLTVPVSYFFEGAPTINGAPGAPTQHRDEPGELTDFLATQEGIQLTRAFIRIKDTRIRRRVVDLIASLGEDSSS